MSEDEQELKEKNRSFRVCNVGGTQRRGLQAHTAHLFLGDAPAIERIQASISKPTGLTGSPQLISPRSIDRFRFGPYRPKLRLRLLLLPAVVVGAGSCCWRRSFKPIRRGPTPVTDKRRTYSLTHISHRDDGTTIPPPATIPAAAGVAAVVAAAPRGAGARDLPR